MQQQFIVILTVILFSGFSGNLFAQPSEKIQKRAARIHQRIFTVDSHTDTPMNLNSRKFDFAKDNSTTVPHSRVDLARMEKGGLDALFLAVFVSQGSRDTEGNLKAKLKAESILDSIYSVVARNRNICGIATTPAEARKLVKSKKKVVFIGIENGYPIGNEISNIKHFYQRGARYITLCHTKNNDICTSSTDTANNKGLSVFGEEVVKEMNRLGMMIDVSHISDKSFSDAIRLSKAPVIASHSCARAICNNPRNLSDEMLQQLAANNGVVQMCILSAYVREVPPFPEKDAARKELRKKYNNFENLTDDQWEQVETAWQEIEEKYPQPAATVSEVVDHIDHIVKVAGINHVGIGTDFDGGGGVDGCRNVSEMKNITQELVNRGYSAHQIRKIWGGNLMRVMKDVEKVARKQR